MNKLLNISEGASMALHAAILMASEPDRTFSTSEIAVIHDMSEAHLSKVMQRLVHADIVTSTRGPGGGFRLAKKPDEISLLEVFEAVEGPLRPRNCLFDRKVCGDCGCIMGDLLEDINWMVEDYLMRTYLTDMTFVYDRLLKR